MEISKAELSAAAASQGNNISPVSGAQDLMG
eukprot:CAMPEP_0184995696 /NCGR_PEP_ID=MMETSP1098-20130426/53674_1 /TAXON_ID=89044 /ORGANISM="Spumella elongata, Strain CCAP 955/1" /LENGTH=30 /DNA_ID= /DNA_START= /DNA_END= /DNA_ORIENTATION=